jgi:hypothetical protein
MAAEQGPAMVRTSDALEAFWKTWPNPPSPLGGRRRGFSILRSGAFEQCWPFWKEREATPPGKLDRLPNRWERLRVAGNGLESIHRFKPETRKPGAELPFQLASTLLHPCQDVLRSSLVRQLSTVVL